MTTAKKSATKKASAKTSTKHAAKKSSSAKKAKKSSVTGQACWPGFERVPGTEAGTKGSCEPKAKQTGAEKKVDSRAAAASKREKGK